MGKKMSKPINRHATFMITSKRLQKIKDVASRRQEGVIVLEDIHDPHNAAAVLRTAEAFGIQKVYFIFNKQAPFNPKKIGKATSSSANKWLTFETFKTAKECFGKLKKQGYTIAATILDEKAKSILKTKLTDPKIALCFGNEHSGLSSEAIKMSDIHLYLPMQGFVQSLNLSVTAAIFMYEVFRQRQPSAKKFSLPPAQNNKLIKEWLKK
jgi:tRNA (guanosine-2'-O-)-methyltransferase